MDRPDWHCVFDVEQEKVAAIRKRIFDMRAKDKLAVIGYHMPFTAIVYVEALKGGG